VRIDDPEVVRREYADESSVAVRAATWANATGPSARGIAFEAVAHTCPQRVLEVGCARGELAARPARELEVEVVALDQSERMVELTRALGVDARLGDVQSLPFEPNLHELWSLCPGETRLVNVFSVENAQPQLERRDANGAVTRLVSVFVASEPR
jgi:SAM-dependent methyltransferase